MASADHNRTPETQPESKAAGIARDSVKLFSSRFAVGLWSLVFSALLVRLLTKPDLALLPVYALITGVGETVAGLGLSSWSLRMVPRLRAEGKEEEALGLQRACARGQLLGGVAVAIIMAAAAKPLSHLFFKSPHYDSLLLALSPAVFLAVLANQFGVLLQSMGRFGPCSVGTLLLGALPVTFAVPLCAVYGAWGLPPAITAGSFFACAYVAWHHYRSVRGPAQHISLWSAFRDSRHFYGASLFQAVQNRADVLLLGIFTTPDLLAVYYVASKLTGYLQMLAGAVSQAALPRIGELQAEDEASRTTGISEVFRYCLLAMLPVCALLIGLAPLFIRVYAGHGYDQAVLPMQLLCLHSAGVAIYAMLRAVILVTAPTRAMLRLHATSAAINSLAIGLGAYLWGVLGVSAGLAIAIVVLCWVAYRLLDPALARLSWAGNTNLLAASCASCALLGLLAWSIRQHDYMLVWPVAIALIVAVSWTLRALRPADRAIVWAVLPGLARTRLAWLAAAWRGTRAVG